MRIEREDLLRLASSLGRTWLETDGVGGYASSTVLLCATSRYHGLLVAPPRPGAARHVFLSRFEETLAAAGREFALSMARYGGGVLHPQGQHYLAGFESEPHPAWTYGIGDVEVRRELLLARGSPTVLVRWRLTGGDTEFTLRLRPFLPCREADALTFENVYLVRSVQSVTGGVACRPYASLPALRITTSRPAAFIRQAHWYRGVEFADDLARGYGGHEDQFTPGFFEVRLAPGDEFVVAATIGERVADPAAAWRKETRARKRAAPGRASEAFLIATPGGRTGVTAGFPWFNEYVRDTCIALPGLLLTRGEVDRCGDALAGLAKLLRNGRLPNRIGAVAASGEYVAADPALWFPRAVRFWEKSGGDEKRLLSEMYAALAAIVRGYRDSTAADLRVDEGGLVVAGASRVAPTWMDAAIDGVSVTPRDGCAVEVNALWCFLLEYATRLAKRARRRGDAREFGAMRRRAWKSFVERFWLPGESRLADAWKDGVPDLRVRPNMVIAASLEFSPLKKTQRAAVVELARAELLTPRGLRTLSPRDPDYRGRYEGNVRSRDAAYHQGTVWPWLLGPYADAWLAARGRGAASKRHLRELLDGFEPHLAERALGFVSEVFDGDAPHRPGGAPAQAWSVAELARARAALG
jgi:glycogen debranching enzyme